MAKKLSKSKAREILHDKTAHGHPLTDKQRKFFAAKAFADIGVSLPNYNDSHVSLPPNFVGMGNSTKGFNYNGSWGGDRMQMGGSLPGLTGVMYTRIGAPSNGPRAKKTKASAKNGKKMPGGGRLPGNGSITTSDVTGATPMTKQLLVSQMTDRSKATGEFNANNLQRYIVPRDEAKFVFGQEPTNPDDQYVHIWSHQSPADLLQQKLHPGKRVSTYDVTGNIIGVNRSQGANVQLEHGGEVSPYYIYGNDFKTKGMQQGGTMFDTKALKARNAKRDSVRAALLEQYPNPKDFQKVNNKMLEYFQTEKPINDNKGQYNHPGKVTKINSPNITMQGIPYPVLGVSDTGHTQMMQPGGEYAYHGTSVTEYPVLASGGDIQNQGQLKNLNQLIDFTNNNHMEQAKSGIHIKTSKVGSLHKHLGVAKDKKIPASKLVIKSTDSPAIRKKKQFAINAKKWKHEDGGLIPYAQQGIGINEITPQGSTPINLSSIASAQQFTPIQQSPNITAGPYQTFGQDNSGTPNLSPSNSGFMDKLGGVGGAMNVIGGVTKGLKMLKQEKTQAKQAEQNAALTNVVAQAASTRPEKVKRKYTRPEDISIAPEQMFPTYGVGTNYLAKNGAEIQNTYNPGDLYSDLGYEPLDDSNKTKQFQWGGFLTSMGEQQAGGIGSSIGSSLGGGNFTLAPNAGSQIGSTVGEAAGSFLGPVGGIVGKFAGGLIGGALDRTGRKISKYNNQSSQNMNRIALQEGAQNLQSQNTSFMEEGGWISHTWQPQVITKFGEHSLKDLLKPDPMMNTLRAGGHISDENYIAPSPEALQTYALGGELKTHWGGKAQTMSQNPYLPDSGETVMFKGQSHDESDGKGNSGIGVTFGNSPVEVERGEPAVKLEDGGTGQNNLVVFGNMSIPTYGVSELGDKNAKGKKFKNYISDLSELEARQNKIVEKGAKLTSETDSDDPFDLLKMNSGKALIEGGNMKLKDIAKKKETAAMIQSAILESAQEHGLDSEALSKGKIKKAKNGAKLSTAQAGANLLEKLMGAKSVDVSKADSLYHEGYVPVAGKKNVLVKETPGTKRIAGAMGSEDFNTWFGKEYKKNPGGVANYKGKPIRLVKGTPGAESQKDYVTLNKNLDLSIPSPQLAGVPKIGEPNISPIAQSHDNNPIPTKGLEAKGLNAFGQLWPYFRPSNKMGLDPNQLAGEYYALANNQLDPVSAQLYHPQLDQPYDISLQDQLNANQADFNAIQKQTGYSPAAQASLAAQKYAANSGVLGAQFRANQAEKTQVYSKNRDILNDAQLKNLAILDQQQVRQAQAKTNTKAIAQSALSSIADKIQQNKLENRTLGVYENLYGYRYDDQGRAYNLNAPAQFNIPQVGPTTSTQEQKKKARNGAIVKAMKAL